MATCIVIGQHRDFRSSTIGGSTEGGAGEIATGAGVRVTFATGASVEKES